MREGEVTDGLAFYGTNVFLDDLTFGPAAWSVVRHGGAEWTPGAADWPSGGLAKDTAVHNHYDHLGNLAVRTNASGYEVASWDHDAFGTVYGVSGDGTTNQYRHTGNHFDAAES